MLRSLVNRLERLERHVQPVQADGSMSGMAIQLVCPETKGIVNTLNLEIPEQLPPPLHKARGRALL